MHPNSNFQIDQKANTVFYMFFFFGKGRPVWWGAAAKEKICRLHFLLHPPVSVPEVGLFSGERCCWLLSLSDGELTNGVLGSVVVTAGKYGEQALVCVWALEWSGASCLSSPGLLTLSKWLSNALHEALIELL